MTKTRQLIMILMAMLFSLSAQAQLTCNDLDSIAGDLDDVAEALSHVSYIGVNGDLDIALGDLTDALYYVSEYEGDGNLNAWVDELTRAWNNEDRDSFERALDSIIDQLDYLFDRDC